MHRNSLLPKIQFVKECKLSDFVTVVAQLKQEFDVILHGKKSNSWQKQ